MSIKKHYKNTLSSEKAENAISNECEMTMTVDEIIIVILLVIMIIPQLNFVN